MVSGSAKGPACTRICVSRTGLRAFDVNVLHACSRWTWLNVKPMATGWKCFLFGYEMHVMAGMTYFWLFVAFFSPPALRACFAVVSKYFSDFCQTNYLDICQTDLHEIYRICRTLVVDERFVVIASIPHGTLPWQPILWAKSHSNTRYDTIRDAILTCARKPT